MPIKLPIDTSKPLYYKVAKTWYPQTVVKVNKKSVILLTYKNEKWTCQFDDPNLIDKKPAEGVYVPKTAKAAPAKSLPVQELTKAVKRAIANGSPAIVEKPAKTAKAAPAKIKVKVVGGTDNLPDDDQVKKLGIAFQLVQNKKNWKEKIDTVVLPATFEAMGGEKTFSQAITYYTGSFPTFKKTAKGVHVRAAGYYAAVGS